MPPPRNAAPMPDSSLIGRLIADRYEIVELLDRGGMGSVFRAIQHPIERPVALKTLDLSDPHGEYRQRFFTEAAVQGRLSHPNTVRMFDYGCTDDGIYFITMELLEGHTLRSVLKTAGPIDPLRVIRIARQICGALQEAHDLGIVHRDLKPGNIFLTEHGPHQEHVKVLDFGLVKELGSNAALSHSGQALGSPMYMAPEQVEGTPVDQRTDVYALGMILWASLMGRPPFHQGNSASIMMQQVRKQVPTFNDVQPNLDMPEGLEDLVQRCVRKRKDQRPASMEIVRSQLAELEKQITGESRNTLPTLPQQAPTHSRMPLALAGAALFGLLLLVGSAIGLGGGGLALWSASSDPIEAPSPPLPSAFPLTAELQTCTEIVLLAPEKGLMRGTIRLQGPPRAGLRGPQQALDVASIAHEKGVVTLNVPGDESGLPVEFEVVCPELRVLRAGRGDVEVQGTVSQAEVLIVVDSGNVTFDALQADAIKLFIESSGDVNLGRVATQRLEVEQLGSGDVRATGSTDLLLQTQRGSGDSSFFGLSAARATVRLYGSGDAEINVAHTLDGSTQNSGDILYDGSPKQITVSAASSGRIGPR